MHFENVSPRRPWIGRWENEEKNNFTSDKELKIYAVICCTIYCLKSINSYNNYGKELIKLIDKYHDVDTKRMGFPKGYSGVSDYTL